MEWSGWCGGLGVLCVVAARGARLAKVRGGKKGGKPRRAARALPRLSTTSPRGPSSALPRPPFAVRKATRPPNTRDHRVGAEWGAGAPWTGRHPVPLARLRPLAVVPLFGVRWPRSVGLAPNLAQAGLRPRHALCPCVTTRTRPSQASVEGRRAAVRGGQRRSECKHRIGRATLAWLPAVQPSRPHTPPSPHTPRSLSHAPAYCRRQDTPPPAPRWARRAAASRRRSPRLPAGRRARAPPVPP